jgi:uncharacterized membrane protein YfcA
LPDHRLLRFAQGFSGFGVMLVSLPGLTLLLSIKTVVPLVNLLSSWINLIIIIQMRRYLKWPKILPLALASVPGIPLGVYFLKIVNVLFFRIGMMQLNQEVATDRSTAEFAVIVADPWQGKGLCWA